MCDAYAVQHTCDDYEVQHMCHDVCNGAQGYVMVIIDISMIMRCNICVMMCVMVLRGM